MAAQAAPAIARRTATAWAVAHPTQVAIVAVEFPRAGRAQRVYRHIARHGLVTPATVRETFARELMAAPVIWIKTQAVSK